MEIKNLKKGDIFKSERYKHIDNTQFDHLEMDSDRIYFKKTDGSLEWFGTWCIRDGTVTVDNKSPIITRGKLQDYFNELLVGIDTLAKAKESSLKKWTYILINYDNIGWSDNIRSVIWNECGLCRYVNTDTAFSCDLVCGDLYNNCKGNGISRRIIDALDKNKAPDKEDIIKFISCIAEVDILDRHQTVKPQLPMAEKALELAKIAHRNQTRKFSGEPYIMHPIRVAVKFNDFYKAVALLHDVIEDTRYTAPRMIEYGIPEDVVRVVEVLSKRDGENYTEFILRIKKDTRATIVKKADIRDNLRDCPEGNMKDKYRLALMVLG